MTVELRCAACGAENPPGSGFCRQCGKAIGPPPDDEPVVIDSGGKISWGVVAIGIVLILAIQLLLNLTVFPLIGRVLLDTTDPSPYGALALILLTGAAVYFVVGVIVGRLSPGYTVREPAIAAIAAAAINALFASAWARGSMTGGPAGIVQTLVVFALLAALGYAGGIVGEKLQKRAEKRRRPAGS